MKNGGSVIVRLVPAALVVLLATGATWASINRGTVQGTVSDQQGLPVTGARVVVKNLDTGVQLELKTNSVGFYLAPELVEGKYSIYVLTDGFKPEDVTDVEVRADDVATVNVRLQLGAVTQHVDVTAANPVVETAASNFGVSIPQTYMEDLPLLGRDMMSTLYLIPGVTQSAGPPGSLVGFNGGKFGGFPDATHIIGSQVSVNGAQAGGNLWYLDGNQNFAEGSDNPIVNPAPDSVAEFQTVTNGYAAEYGKTAGAVFNVVLKSGTNRLHGDVYENNRNSYFEARNPFAGRNPYGQQNPSNFMNWNQFGGTLGGPVAIPHVYNGRNRTFFFASWDISRLVETSVGTLYSVPTLKERQGDFSEFPGVVQYGIYDPMSTTYNAALGSYVRQPFLNPGCTQPTNGCLATSLPANRISPITSYFINQYPLPNFLDPRQQNAATGGCLNTCNNFQTTYGSDQNTNTVIAKVDHQIGTRSKVFGEFLFNPTNYLQARLPWTGVTAQLKGFNDSGTPWYQLMLNTGAGWTATISPTSVNEMRGSYTRSHGDPKLPPINELGWPSIESQLAGTNTLGANTFSDPTYGVVPQISSNITNFGGTSVLPQITQAFTFLDNFTNVRGRHTIKFGLFLRDDRTFGEGTALVTLRFPSNLDTNPVTGLGGNSAAVFLMGDVGNQNTGWKYSNAVAWSNYSSGYYVQDDYRVKPNFTVNVGLRWDLIGNWKEKHNNASIFDFSLPNPDDPARLGGLCYLGTSCHPSGWAFPTHYRDFSPRLNFAWQPFGNQKTVVRGGIDYIYTDGEAQDLGQFEGPSQSPGYGTYGGARLWTQDATGQGFIAAGVTPSFILTPGVAAPALPPVIDPKPVDFQALGPSQGFQTHVPLAHDPTVTVWNLQVQRQLRSTLALSVGYVGNKSDHIISDNGFPYNYIPTAVRQQLLNGVNALAPVPADLVPFFGTTQYAAGQFYKPYPQYGSVEPYLNGGDDKSIYHGLHVKLEERLSHGLNFLVAYTYQKNVGSAGVGGYLSNTWTGGNVNFASGRGRLYSDPGYSGSGGQGGEYQNPDCKACDRALLPDEEPQILNVAWTYELPFGPGKAFASGTHGIARQLVQGWKVASNFNAQSGTPLTITCPSNGMTNRCDLVGNPRAGVRSSRLAIENAGPGNGWWNANAFTPAFGLSQQAIAVATSGTAAQQNALPSWWTFGTEGVRPPSVRMPGFLGGDASLAKDFKVGEGKSLQFRWEVYNFLNKQELGFPNTSWCLPPNADGTTDAVHQFGCSFGKITSIQTDPRSMLFALKFVF